LRKRMSKKREYKDTEKTMRVFRIL
jgi:hypothetical protein